MTLGMKPPQYAMTVTVPGPDGKPRTFEDSLHLTPEELKQSVAERPTQMYSVTECGNYAGCFGMDSLGSVAEAVVLEDPVVLSDGHQRPDECRPPLADKCVRQAHQRAGLMQWSAAECVNTRIENKAAHFASRAEHEQWRKEQKEKLQKTVFVLPMQALAEEETRRCGFFVFNFGDDTWKSPAQYCHRKDPLHADAASSSDDDIDLDLDDSESDADGPEAAQPTTNKRKRDTDTDTDTDTCPTVKNGFWCGLPYNGLRTQLTGQQRSGLFEYYLRLGRAPLPAPLWTASDWKAFAHNNHDALAALGGDCIPTQALQHIMHRTHWDRRQTAQLPALGAIAAVVQDLWAQRICRGLPYELMPDNERVWGMPPWVMPSKLWPVYARTEFDWLRPNLYHLSNLKTDTASAAAARARRTRNGDARPRRPHERPPDGSHRRRALLRHLPDRTRHQNPAALLGRNARLTHAKQRPALGTL